MAEAYVDAPTYTLSLYLTANVFQPWGHDPTWCCLEFKRGHLKCVVID